MEDYIQYSFLQLSKFNFSTHNHHHMHTKKRYHKLNYENKTVLKKEMLKLLYRAEHCAVIALLLKQPKTINAKKKKFLKIQPPKKHWLPIQRKTKHFYFFLRSDGNTLPS